VIETSNDKKNILLDYIFVEKLRKDGLKDGKK
jgi:hypothetical protein